jgi:hypothetical protein
LFQVLTSISYRHHKHNLRFQPFLLIPSRPESRWQTDSPHSRSSTPAVSSFIAPDQHLHLPNKDAAATEPKGDSGFETAGADDFLSREKALLGDDANQFATGNDNAAFVEDGDDDLLGGGGGEEVTEFENSFPAIDTRNEVYFSHPNLHPHQHTLHKLTIAPKRT